MNETLMKIDPETLTKVDAPALSPAADLPAAPRKPVRPEVPVAAPAPRQPKILQSALHAVRETVERRTRDWISTAHIVEQSRGALAAASDEMEFGYKTLSEVLPLVEEANRDLTSAMQRVRDGEDARTLDALFESSDRALECLERVASDLSAQLAWCRNTFERYADLREHETRLRREVGAESR